ncbi:hypothetical protein GUJ93_ZPchr0002g26320 [Zizania palustris]|uniref:Uncharacterized protein n=1 Tax=Zizania palustris TaxID=103762 RepID=A0A8J5RSK8_ZIZPA|nr:hypothetical protein GUJ93_ZPchr0002g26320 [Zizania palustris]
MANNLLNLFLIEVAAIVTIVLLVVLSSNRRRSGHPALQLFVWVTSTLFLPLMLRNTIDTTHSSSMIHKDSNLTKVIHQLVAAELAKNSFAVSLNAYLLADYMKQLYGQDGRGEGAQKQDDVQAFPYLVMGEDNLHIEPTPQEYRIGRTSASSLSVNAGHVVTMYRIWRLSSICE